METDRTKPPLLLPPRVSCSILAGLGPVRLRVTAVEATFIAVDAAGFPSERYDEVYAGECVLSRNLENMLD